MCMNDVATRLPAVGLELDGMRSFIVGVTAALPWKALLCLASRSAEAERRKINLGMATQLHGYFLPFCSERYLGCF
ncbi:unnamed protein product, partial [Ixodes pacificus]